MRPLRIRHRYTQDAGCLTSPLILFAGSAGVVSPRPGGFFLKIRPIYIIGNRCRPVAVPL